MGKTSEPVALPLPEVIDRDAAQQIAEQINPSIAEGVAIEIGGSDVRKIGQVGLQLLLSIRRSVQDCNATLTIVHPSDALGTVIALAGLETELLATPATQ